jgi:hypothetical protein
VRISVTLIDQYRKFMLDEYVSEQDLIESVKGVWKPTRKVLCGQSFDSIVQDPLRYQTEDGYSCDGISWPGGEMEEKVLPLFQHIKTWQPKEIRPVTVNETPVNLVTKVDALDADGIVEVKTTWSGFDYERYQAAHQWRHYLLNFGAKWIRYHVFDWREPASGPFKLYGVETFTLYPYAGMEAECLETLGGLVDFIKSKKLEQYVADDHPRLLGRTA